MYLYTHTVLVFTQLKWSIYITNVSNITQALKENMMIIGLSFYSMHEHPKSKRFASVLALLRISAAKLMIQLSQSLVILS